MTSDFIRLVDGLEDRADGYLTLDDIKRSASSELEVDAAVRDYILLLDHRTRVDGTSVTLCRLNRRHPDVIRVTAW